MQAKKKEESKVGKWAGSEIEKVTPIYGFFVVINHPEQVAEPFRNVVMMRTRRKA